MEGAGNFLKEVTAPSSLPTICYRKCRLSPSKPPSLFKNFPQDNLNARLSGFLTKARRGCLGESFFRFGRYMAQKTGWRAVWFFDFRIPDLLKTGAGARKRKQQAAGGLLPEASGIIAFYTATILFPEFPLSPRLCNHFTC